MPPAGSPDALLAAAEQVAGAVKELSAVEKDMASHARSITVDWSGLAAPLALARITGDVETVRRAADAVAGVVGPLQTYADELRAAQRDFAVGAQQRAGPVQPEGRLLMEAAAQRALVANEAAARAFHAAADALPGAATTTPQRGDPDLGAAFAEAGNIAASLANAALQHPASTLALAGGGALAALSVAGVLGGTAATATGVGSPLGVPLTGASLAGLTAGVGLAGAGAIDLTQHALGDDRVTPFQVNAHTDGEATAPPFDPPGEITGLTRHAGERAVGRDGGTGVSDEAMADAVANPSRPPVFDPDRNTYRYQGVDATVVLNEGGRVVTTWAETSNGWRNR